MVGIGYNLSRSEAKSELSQLGVEYEEVLNYCKEEDPFTCLTNTEIELLFDHSLQQSAVIAQRVLFEHGGSYDQLCCSLRLVLVELAFSLRERLEETFGGLVGHLARKEWREAALELRASQWCKKRPDRCAEDVRLIMIAC